MLKAIGFTDEDLAKPIIGIANTWIETMPCNYNLRRLAARVKDGVRAAGGTPMEFNTIAISDGVTMGTEGMKGSLVSRELVADSVELVGRCHYFDALVVLVACDKTIPGGAMGLARVNVPGLVLYGGTIQPGHYKGRDLTVLDVFEAVGANSAGKIDDAELKAIEDLACPGPGACGGQYTANTMATALAFLGISPLDATSVPATDELKDDVGYKAGQLVMDQLRRRVLPSDILTRQAFENAIASVAATGGSTNAVLHLLALAREVGVPLTIDDFDVISTRTPLIADLKPGGRYTAVDTYKAGGIGVVAKRLVEAGLVTAGLPTPSGRTLAQEAEETVETLGMTVIRHDEAIRSSPPAASCILKGNIAPDGCVIKVGGLRAYASTDRPARVFKREEDAMAAVTSNQIDKERRGRHPLRRSARRAGMREMLGVAGSTRRSRPW